MLDKSDLQQIKKLLHEEVDPIKDNINLLKDDVSGLKDDVSGLKDDMKSVKGDIGVLKGDVSVLKDNSSKIRKDINTIVSFFDREYVDLRDRVSRIEEILELTPR